MDLKPTLPLLEDHSSPRTFILTHLDLYNWGGFSHRHCAEIDLEGTAIIGPTGSGKTTLVDALMTLLTEHPRYNLASTGGHDSDRDLVSYIRGVSGAGNNSGDNEHIARPGKTVTGIAARFSNGDERICLGAIFWIDGTSSSASDLKRLWIFSRTSDQGLDQWLEAHHAGGARQLKQMRQETAGLNVDESKSTYLARVRSMFEVGENAFTLLNRAAGLKQLNSIDEIFRELVLDDKSAFQRAADVAREFDALTEIHSELQLAQRQQQSLLPVKAGWEARQDLAEKLANQQELETIVPLWFAEHSHRLWSERHEQLFTATKQQEINEAAILMDVEAHKLQVESLHGIYLKAGGATIQDLEDQIKQQKEIVEQRSHYACDYRQSAKHLGLDETISSDKFLKNKSLAEELLNQKIAELEDQQQAVYNSGAIEKRCKDEVGDYTERLEHAKKNPHSNIQQNYLNFRTALAEALDLDESKLPFVAELIQVKEEESRWRGAIERAIGSQRLRILVPKDYMKAALRWINGRHTGLHVRLKEVEEVVRSVEFFTDGFTRKLNYKPHPFRDAVKHLLAEVDRHCVETVEELHNKPRSMTPTGLMSGAGGFFEKQDQKPLNADWWTGFDNKDLLNELSEKLRMATLALEESRRELEKEKQRASGITQSIALLNSLLSLDFASVDVVSAEQRLNNLNDRLGAQAAPDSDTGKAKEAWTLAKDQLSLLERKYQQHRDRLVELRNETKVARDRLTKSFQLLGEGLTDSQRETGAKNLPVPGSDDLDSIDQMERKSSDSVRALIDKLRTQLNSCDKELIRAMERAKKEDSGALVDASTDLTDIQHYLERLKVLTEEALPEKLSRFLAYLNQSSDQGVTQLLTDIENEVSLIEERISDLNNTLSRVNYQPGRYLRLDPQRVVHQSLSDLQKAQRQLRSAVFIDDQGESHYRALKQLVELLREASEKRKVQANLALLDPRYRLKFSISVIDRDTGSVKETRTGSQGGSGGEKEIIASYVLTASLSYALCPPGSRRPLFGTVVLDEAFSRSSHVVAGRIISALDAFGLHPLFVTPNKELRLLRQHTRSAILVHRKGLHSTLTSLSWEELDHHAKQRIVQYDEVAT